VPVNPRACEERSNSIVDTDLRALAWLADMNCWSMLLPGDFSMQICDQLLTAV